MSKEISDKVIELAKEKRLSCKQALALANELGVSPAKIGEVANAADIKIVACQLGCFG